MNLLELIEDTVNQKLQEICIDHTVTFIDFDTEKEITIFCTHAELAEDDGNIWIEFTDDKNYIHQTYDQGANIWFEVKN